MTCKEMRSEGISWEGADERRVMDLGAKRSLSERRNRGCRSLVVSGDMSLLSASAGMADNVK